MRAEAETPPTNTVDSSAPLQCFNSIRGPREPLPIARPSQLFLRHMLVFLTKAFTFL